LPAGQAYKEKKKKKKESYFEKPTDAGKQPRMSVFFILKFSGTKKLSKKTEHARRVPGMHRETVSLKGTKAGFFFGGRGLELCFIFCFF
jgi:hypothetical protein